MMDKVRNSWALMERSISVLMSAPKLFVFPIVTFFSTFFIFFFFMGLFIFQPTGHSLKDKAHWKALSQKVFTQESLNRAMDPANKDNREQRQLEYNRSGLLIVTALYFFSMFLATFFNVAFYHEIIEALNGRPTGIRRGFKFALSRIRAIVLWSVMAGLIGYIIKQIEARVGFVGKIVVNLIGLAWSVAAVFAIPVIICDQSVNNPLTVLKTSAAALRKNWGESLVGFVGLSSASLIVVLLSTLPFMGLVIAGAYVNNAAVSAISFMGWFLFVFVFSYVTSIASNIYQCALYLFASTGQVPAGYDRAQMNLAWKHK